jgi:hypothetical protein
MPPLAALLEPAELLDAVEPLAPLVLAPPAPLVLALLAPLVLAPPLPIADELVDESLDPEPVSSPPHPETHATAARQTKQSVRMP